MISKRKKSIILLALIIITFIILAGISIAILAGKNGILNKVSIAKEKHQESDVQDNIESTYVINSVNENNMKVTITLISNTEIETINTPDGNAIYANRNKIAIDFEAILGKNYTFKIKLKDDEELKECVLKADTNSKPIISENINDSYPKLTQYGVKLNKKIDIDYGDGTNNYYSLDGGKTWNVYNGTIIVNEKGTILAKTLIDNEITKVEIKNYTINLAKDALGIEAYTGGDSSYVQTGEYKYMDIESELIGKKLYAKVGSSRTKSYITFFNKDNTEIKTETIENTTDSHFGVEYFKEVKYTIPEGTTRIGYKGRENNEYWGYYWAVIADIGYDNSPDKDIENIYPIMKLSSSCQKGYQKVTFNYSGISIEKLYSFDGETWNKYDEPVSVDYGRVVYAKGIDKNENETRITTHKAEAPNDMLPEAAFDGRDDTYVETGEYKYISINSELIGKKLYAKVGSSRTKSYIIFLSKDNAEIKTETIENTTDNTFGLEYFKEVKYTIPEGTTKIGYKGSENESGYYWAALSEIGVRDE